MSNSYIVQAHATGEEVSQVVMGIEESLVGVQKGVAIIALLSMTIMLMKPEIATEDLHDAVRDTSQYICLLMSDDPAQQVDIVSKNLLN